MNRPHGAPRVGHWITYVRGDSGILKSVRVLPYTDDDIVNLSVTSFVHLSNENIFWRRGKIDRNSFAGQALLAAVALLK